MSEYDSGDYKNLPHSSPRTSRPNRDEGLRDTTGVNAYHKTASPTDITTVKEVSHPETGETTKIIKKRRKIDTSGWEPYIRNTRVYQVVDHYTGHGYKEVRQRAKFLNLPDKEPVYVPLLLTLLSLALPLPLLLYWRHVRSQPHGSEMFRQVNRMADTWHAYEKKWRLYRLLNYFSSKGYHHMTAAVPVVKWPKEQPLVFPYILLAGATLAGLYLLLKYGNRLLPRVSVPQNVVMLYGLPAGKTIPSISPYVLKLETYLRMAGIPYQIDFRGKPSSEGKNPWITYNGVDVADSQVCIDYLNKKCAVDLDKNLGPKERAVARAFRSFAEDRLMWPLDMDRFVYSPFHELIDQMHISPAMKALAPLKWFLMKRPAWRSRARAAGIGDKDESFVMDRASSDIDALSTFLGNKTYFMGDQVSEVDAAIFGQLAQILWTMPSDGPLRPKFNNEWTNLAGYCNRIKNRYWPDWDHRLSTGKHTMDQNMIKEVSKSQQQAAR